RLREGVERQAQRLERVEAMVGDHHGDRGEREEREPRERRGPAMEERWRFADQAQARKRRSAPQVMAWGPDPENFASPVGEHHSTSEHRTPAKAIRSIVRED